MSDEAPKRRIWLFGVHLSYQKLTALLSPEPEDAQRSAFHSDDNPAMETEKDPITDLLGAEWLDHDFVKAIDTSKLGDEGLAGYLVQSAGIHQDQVSAVRDVLAAVGGPVIIVFEEAFGGNPTAMHPDPRLVYLGTFTDLPGPVQFRSAPFVPKPTRTKGYGVMVAAAVLLAIPGLMVWGW